MSVEGRRGVAIVTAMGIESAGLSRALQVGAWDRRLRRGWHEGLLAGCPVVLATCGVGMKAARQWARILLEDYEPRLVILTGASGGVAPHVEVGDLVLAQSIHEVTEQGAGNSYAADVTFLATARQVAPLVSFRPVRKHRPLVVEAQVGTVGKVVANQAWGARLAAEHGIVAVEMEGAAIAQACQECGVPFLAVRAISDVIGRSWQMLTMIRYLVPAQRNAERLVLALIQYLRNREPAPGAIQL